MENEALYQVALTMIPNIGSVQAKILVDHLGDASAVFKASVKQLSAIEGIGEIRAASIKKFTDFSEAEKELEFCGKHYIKILFLTHEDYPKRLLHCYDAPAVVYYRGNANLNTEKIVSIVGTRNNTEYGKQTTEKLIEELSALNILVVSGLAFGIDAIAHKACIANDIATVGVMGHGFNTIYPSANKSLAKDMLQSGGLLTEFTHKTPPDKHNFPKRNRIVAGMADATILVETAAKGGSMITAEMAYSYNRDIFAVPGRITDTKSSGCIKLIQQNKAVLLSDATQLLEAMGWQSKKKQQPKKQRSLFIELTSEEQLIVDALNKKETVHIDELYYANGLNSSTVAAAILNLEMQGIIKSLPGKLYTLL